MLFIDQDAIAAEEEPFEVHATEPPEVHTSEPFSFAESHGDENFLPATTSESEYKEALCQRSHSSRFLRPAHSPRRESSRGGKKKVFFSKKNEKFTHKYLIKFSLK